ncbi:hypothetical protein G7K71_07215 [Desulfofundulus sp. TPOSR]|uniref:hypothetical protein n=1 Tax=Desulfofundulus sp. TPOSR TaxID=2714340 RepID=UPI00140CCAF8|nr:hypothetical protein [Desulfofundulus sp. TPOSR]NHM26773.1 hypothetical protein [Desulfofundulus sp. TPOSR]
MVCFLALVLEIALIRSLKEDEKHPDTLYHNMHLSHLYDSFRVKFYSSLNTFYAFLLSPGGNQLPVRAAEKNLVAYPTLKYLLLFSLPEASL